MLKEALEACELSNVRTQGPSFTWSNNRFDEGYTKERLDRAIANREWHQIFSSSCVFVFPAIKLDHCPLHLVPTSFSNPEVDSNFNNRRKFLFRWEAAWQSHEGCFDTIKEA